MLTHGNFIAGSTGGLMHFGTASTLSNADVHLSYLPLAHSFERIIQAALFVSGARIGFFQGDIKLLMDDLQTLKYFCFNTFHHSCINV
eukprot:m.250041 g.250041  ORF g.250041 m.250041 type:complete len:88 (+) comp40309_c1_seq59:156-419(+)